LIGVVYNIFGAALRGWIVTNDIHDDPNPGIRDTDDNDEVYNSSGNAPPSLIEVGKEKFMYFYILRAGGSIYVYKVYIYVYIYILYMYI
jgi:hypothetical protein